MFSIKYAILTFCFSFSLGCLKKSSEQDSSILSKDLAWQSELAKYQALLKLFPSREPVFLASFFLLFPTEHQQLMQVLEQAGIHYTERQSSQKLSSALLQVCLAKDLPLLPPAEVKYYFNGKHPPYQRRAKNTSKAPCP